MSASIVLGLSLFLSLVINIPTVEKALSASMEVGGIVFRASNNFSARLFVACFIYGLLMQNKVETSIECF
jgi:hypothetical protein